jgi:hypothetical protein
MQTVLVTIEGPQNVVDAELAGDVPIRTLAPLLLELCGVGVRQSPAQPQLSAGRLMELARLAQEGYAFEAAGSVWAVELRPNEPLPLDRSLIACQVVDGMRLRLHDLVARQRQRELEAQFVPQEVAPSGATAGVGVVWRRE